jgi:hypothetical protein
MGQENLTQTGVRAPDRPARSESLYRLRYPGCHKKKNILPLPGYEHRIIQPIA